MTWDEAMQLERWAFGLEDRAAKADALEVVADAVECAGGSEKSVAVRRSWADTLRLPAVIGPELSAATCDHVWSRTGSDTLFCFYCKTKLVGARGQMNAQCCLVYPFWVRLGWVHWAGTPERERLMNIEYRRCAAPAVMAPTLRDGFAFRWCEEHAAAMGQSGSVGGET